MAVTRSSTATWAIPTFNEWYKAGWYVGGGTNAGFWDYPTQNNNPPSYVLSATGTNNANYTASISTPPFTTSSDPTNWLTPVGAFAGSPGPYGTFDMGGDVQQWNETVDAGIGRGVGGGSWAGDYLTLLSGGAGYGPPSTFGATTGFRVEALPEPSALILLASAAALFLLRSAVLSSATGRAVQLTTKWVFACPKSAQRARKARTPSHRLGYRSLRFEWLEEKRLLAALYFDAALGNSWTGKFWYQNQFFTGNAQYWADGSDAFFEAGSGTIVLSTVVKPNSITFFPARTIPSAAVK